MSKQFFSAVLAFAFASAGFSLAVAGEAEVKNGEGPKVVGHPFVMPAYPQPRFEREENAMRLKIENDLRARGLGSPKVQDGMPQGTKERGASITPSFTVGSLYRGLGEIFQYTNHGMPNKDVSCGQAAIATILTHHSIKPRDTGYTVVNEVYRRYGPDNLGGSFGTSWQQMGRALKGYGVPYNWYSGEAGLKNALDQYKPCILMLDVGAMRSEGWGPLGGHWVVAYGYDSNYIYFTNWNPNSQGYADGGKCTLSAFRNGWNTWLTRANGTPNMFLCPKG